MTNIKFKYLLSGIILISIGYPVTVHSREITILEKSDNSQVAILSTIEAGRGEFVSVVELVTAFNLSYSIDRSRKELSITTPKGKIKIFAINPFVVIDDKIRQMPIAVLYINGHFYAPLAYFLFTIKDFLPFELEYDDEQHLLWLIRSHSHILSLDIIDKQNGTLIRIGLDQIISLSNIFTSDANGWFYIDLYGAYSEQLIPTAINKKSGTINNISSIKLSDDTARLGFELLKKIKDKQIEIHQNPPEVIVSLRTHEEVPAALLAQLEREREKWRIDVIIIDPGHGGKDPGAIGRGGLKEKEVTLNIAKEIKKRIENDLKLKVIMTRDSDTFIPLEKRTEIANQSGGKLFLSIHADSNPNRNLQGHTVYFMGPAKTEEARRVAQYENSVIRFEDSQEKYAGLSDAAFILAANAQNSFNKESEEFAAELDKEIKTRNSIEGLGVRQAGFYVLYGTSMPNILLETAFISNTNDEKKLKTKDFFRSIAESINTSIEKFKARYEVTF